jgi:2'-5' RNA ligase
MLPRDAREGPGLASAVADDPGTSTPAVRLPAKEPTLRLFVAAYPPPGAAEQMLALLDALRLPRHRRTPAEGVHMTVLFLGEQPAPRLPAIADAIRAVATMARPITLTPEGLIPLPPRREARLVALECRADAGLATLYSSLVAALGPLTGTTHRDRLLPHFTLARFAPGARVDRRAPLPRAAGLGPMVVRELVLVRSVLGPGGAVHTPVECFALGGPGVAGAPAPQ